MSSSMCTQRVKVPLLSTELMGSFIGRKGANLKLIEKKHKVLIRIGEPPECVVSGNSEISVQLAVLDMEILALNLYTLGCSHTVQIPESKIGFLIGKNGRSISDIRTNSGVKIDIERLPDLDPDEKSLNDRLVNVTVFGDYVQICCAVRLIVGRLGEMKKVNPHDDAKSRQFFESFDRNFV